MKFDTLSLTFLQPKAGLLKAVICAALFFTMVAAPSRVSAQDTQGSDAVVNLSSRELSVAEFIKEIESQTNFLVVLSDNEVDTKRRVVFPSSSDRLTALLNAAFDEGDISYTFDSSYIVLTRQGARNEVQQSSVMNVTGVVRDNRGTALIGVSVVVKGTMVGAATGMDGSFTVRASRGDILEVSYLGYASQEVTVQGPTVNIILEEADFTIDNVVVTALGIKRAEKALTYNVQAVSGKELTSVKDANFMNSLIGKVAGVNINTSATGPGGAVKVVMRGAKSLTKDNNAIYVIDGIPMFNANASMGETEGAYAKQPGTDAAADINPEDIESMSVLTGPSATALYGSEAANGVILITTKKGTADRTTITVSNSTTFSSPLVMPRFQNKYGNETSDFGSWGAIQDRFRYNPKDFFNTGSNIMNSVTLSTGSEKSQSYLSAASTNAKGILPNNTYNRYNFSYRNTTNFLDNKFVLDAGFTFVVQDYKNMKSQGQYFNPLTSLYLWPRGEDFSEVQLYERYNSALEVNTQYWPWNDQGLELQNPYWVMHRMNYTTKKKRYMANASLQYNITDWLNIIGRAKIDNSNYIITDERYAGTISTLSGTYGFFGKTNRLETQFYGDVLVNIQKNFGSFSLHANIGGSIKDLRMDSQSQEGYLDHVNLFTTENIIRDGNYKDDADGFTEQTQSVFANVEMGYKGMVYLTLTGRNEWPSQLAYTSTSSYFYPSVGLSGVLSEMMQMPDWLSFAKVRFSYSSVGSSFDRYMTLYYWTFEGGRIPPYQGSPNAEIYDLKPERTNSLEAGFNLRFLKNMFNLDFTFYKTNTLNQTFFAELPASSPYDYAPVQAGDVQNTGIELSLGFNNNWGDFGWSSNMTYTFNKNKIKKLANGVINPVSGEVIDMPYLDVADLGDAGGPFVRLIEGGSMGDIYINRALQRDGNGNIFLDASTMLPQMTNIEPTKVGSLLAKSQIGWNNTFTWKGIDLNVVVSARLGGHVVSGTQAIMDRYGVSKASADLRDNGLFINENPIDVRSYYNIVAAGTGVGAHYIYSATNVRLQELSLGYTLPSSLFNDVVHMTVSVVGRNLFMIYNKAPFDPELSASTTSTFYTGLDYFMMPSLRNIGFNVKFRF